MREPPTTIDREAPRAYQQSDSTRIHERHGSHVDDDIAEAAVKELEDGPLHLGDGGQIDLALSPNGDPLAIRRDVDA
jgi:hypothetical protein